jgi:hypothetical protein
LKPEDQLNPILNKMARALTKHKIHFTTKDADPRIEIQGGRFTTQELMMLSLENKITNPDLLEVLRTKRTTSGRS